MRKCYRLGHESKIGSLLEVGVLYAARPWPALSSIAQVEKA